MVYILLLWWKFVTCYRKNIYLVLRLLKAICSKPIVPIASIQLLLNDTQVRASWNQKMLPFCIFSVECFLQLSSQSIYHVRVSSKWYHWRLLIVLCPCSFKIIVYCSMQKLYGVAYFLGFSRNISPLRENHRSFFRQTWSSRKLLVPSGLLRPVSIKV